MKKILLGVVVGLIVAGTAVFAVHIISNKKDNTVDNKIDNVTDNKEIKKEGKIEKVASLDLNNYSQNAFMSLVNGLYILTYDENYKNGHDDTIIVMDSNYNTLLREESVSYKIYDKSFIIYREGFTKKYNIEDGKLVNDTNFEEMYNLYKDSYSGFDIEYLYDELYYINKYGSKSGVIYDAKLKKEIQTGLTNVSYYNDLCSAHSLECYKYIAIVKDGKTGVINNKNELIEDFEYDYNSQYSSIPFYLLNEDSFILRKNGKYKYINVKNNKTIDDVIYINRSDMFKERHLIQITNIGNKKYNIISYNMDGSILDQKTFDNFNETKDYFENYYVLLINDNEFVYLTDDGKLHSKKIEGNIVCQNSYGGNSCTIFKNKVDFKDGKYVLYNGDNKVGEFSLIYELGNKILVSDDYIGYNILDENFNYLLDTKYNISSYFSVRPPMSEDYKYDTFALYNGNSVIEYNKGNLSSPIEFNFDTSKYKICYIIDKKHIVVEEVSDSFPAKRKLIDVDGNTLVSDFINYEYISGYHYIEYWTQEKFNIKSSIIEIYDNDFNKINDEDLAAKVRSEIINPVDKDFYLGLDGLYIFN